MAKPRHYRPVCVLPYSGENLQASVPQRATSDAGYASPNIGYRKALVQFDAVRAEEPATAG
ncbi:hypothetical protein [Azospirillum sp. Sh1]|uniref:hypothetical protein n=1 Tax=Azospirillum sp. Sh1 TaxID=2607285 RepID=UPI00165E9D21|nr:hypothetical protein [Azospirillum sp. Sh1]